MAVCCLAYGRVLSYTWHRERHVELLVTYMYYQTFGTRTLLAHAQQRCVWCVCVCVCVCQRKTKDRADGMREKVPIALDGIRTCISGIHAHSASDCTTTAGTPRVSRMKHFRHPPVSSIAKQSCMKDSNSYLRECVCVQLGAVKLVLWRHWMHLNVMRPVMSENQFHCIRLCVCVTMKESARRTASTTDDTGDI